MPRASTGRWTTTVGAAVLWLLYLTVHLAYALRTGSPVGAAFFVQLTLITYLFVRRRDASLVSTRRTDWAIASVAAFGSFLLQPGGHAATWSNYVAIPLQVLGLIVTVVSLIELGRSFGIVPADRGVVSTGMYRFVRHPAYLGYAIGELGYLFQSFSLWNVALVTTMWICQYHRIRAEEGLLSRNADYMRYKERVRFALLPGVW